MAAGGEDKKEDVAFTAFLSEVRHDRPEGPLNILIIATGQADREEGLRSNGDATD